MKRFKRYLRKIRWKVMNNEQRIDEMRKKGVTIGEDCYIAGNVTFGTEPYLITIGNKVRLTSNVQFVTHDGSLWVLRNMGLTTPKADKFGGICIGDNVNIGWNSVIMPGVNIGNNCIIGINSVVTKNIPDNSVVAGIPAKVISNIEDYFMKNKNLFLETKEMGEKEKEKYLKEHFNIT